MGLHLPCTVCEHEWVIPNGVTIKKEHAGLPLLLLLACRPDDKGALVCTSPLTHVRACCFQKPR
jgi:hypothetical protein